VDGESSGELWSVHGGGFYHSQKYLVAPSKMPDDLHWFKWEAYFTWISGFSLLVVVYYFGAQAFLIDPAKAALSVPDAVGLGLLAIALGWLFYDTLCASPLGKNNRVVGVIWFLFLFAAEMILNRVFTARGAYLHIGAMIGSVMVGNVFFVIIPNQRKVVGDLVGGRTPDPALGKAARQRSLHNNYMTLPVLFIMISHHYPMTYGAQRPWLVLALLGLTGVAVRHVFNLRHRGVISTPLLALVAALALASVTYVSLEKVGGGVGGDTGADTGAGQSRLTYADIQPILARHCAGCHAQHPTNPAVTSPPLGLVFDTYEHVSALAPRIKVMAVDSEAMPLGNQTGMTKEEREKLGAWIAQGAPK
jgi:uncharacterized membrane protein